MRAGPLSKIEVISILNRYFVPVFASNEVSGPNGSGPAEERAARTAITAAFEKSHLGTGDVRVYLIAPDGRPVASVDIGRAMDTPQLVAALKKAVQELGTPGGPPVVPPKPQSSAPGAGPAEVVLHVAARRLASGSWSEFPAENWILLNQHDIAAMLPPGELAVGTSWTVDAATSRKLLTDFYPPTEDTTSADRNRIEQQSLQVTVVSMSGGMAFARLSGKLRMERSFYPGRTDYKPLEATIIGFMDFDPTHRRIESFALATEKATYGSDGFVAALHALTGAGMTEKKPKDNDSEGHSKKPSK